MDCKPAKNQIFLLLSIKESCAAEDCMGSLAALMGRPYICAALRQHISYDINTQNLAIFPEFLIRGQGLIGGDHYEEL